MKKLITLLALGFCLNGKAQIITTVAGNGTAGFSGDSGQCITAELNYPRGVTFDGAGNLYIADYFNQRIRKINTAGVITTVAGNGNYGFSGDGGQATATELHAPSDVKFDAVGNMYIADFNNHRIRKVNTTGIISTVAGNGTAGFSGDGGQATSAELWFPHCIVFDAIGNMYIADDFNNRIRKVNTAGIISTVAGSGGSVTGSYSGDGGPATAATLYGPFGVALDAIGNLYIADMENYRIRKVNTSGIISTVAGGGSHSAGAGGLATDASLGGPYTVITDAISNLYISETNNGRVDMVNSSGIISTIVGDGSQTYGGDGGLATAAEIYGPIGLAFDATGNLFIADYFNYRIRKVTNVANAGIKGFTNNNEQLNIYPNPNDGLFNLAISQFDNLKSCSIIIYNVTGECVHRQVATSANCQIDLSNLQEGVYNIILLSYEGVVNKRLVIVR